MRGFVFALALAMFASASVAAFAAPATGGTFNIVESIPLGVNLTTNMSIADSWLELLNSAKYEVDIACMYMTLNNKNESIGGGPGKAAYDAIIAAAKRGVKVRIAKSNSGVFGPDDVEVLVQEGYATAQYVNFSHIVGGGVLHTKFMAVDNTSFYVGSANMDWRSLTQVKEFAIYFRDTPKLATELYKVFEQYWILGSLNAAPKQWPTSVTTKYNRENPLRVDMNGTTSDVFFSLAPDVLVPEGWTRDQDAITEAMGAANDFIWIEVMDYVPAVVYASPSYYWNVIDNAMRMAAYNKKTQVRLLIGHWGHSMPIQLDFLQSLNQIPNIEVKWFIVPEYKVNIPYTRVNHAKWMITDKVLYIDTSNWTGDYFVNTAGVGTTTDNPDARAIGQHVFLRDWNSEYTHDLPPCSSSQQVRSQ